MHPKWRALHHHRIHPNDLFGLVPQRTHEAIIVPVLVDVKQRRDAQHRESEPGDREQYIFVKSKQTADQPCQQHERKRDELHALFAFYTTLQKLDARMSE